MSETDLEIVESPLPDEIVEASKKEPEETKEPEEQAPEEATGEEEVIEEVSEEPSEEEPSEEPEKPKRKRRNLQKRISQLTQQRIAAEQEAAKLREQIAATQIQTTDEEPKQEDFKSYDEFILARAEFLSRKAVRDEVAQLNDQFQTRQTEREQIARAADWSLKVEDARDKYDDFDEVVFDPDNTFFTDAVFVALQGAENGTDVAYHLASNPKLGREIAALAPIQAVIRIGQLSQTLREPVKPKPTAASPPIKTVKTSGAKPSKDPEKMSLNEYIKWRREGGGK